MGRMKTQKELEKIALEDEDWSCGCKAIQKLTNQELLEKIALEDEDWSIRSVAIEKI